MKNLIFVLFFGIALIMTSKNDKDFIVRSVYSVDSVDVIKTGKNEILLKTISTVPNPCYQFSHIETEQVKDSMDQIQVKVFAKIDKTVNCISVIGKMEAEIKIEVPKTGKYKLVFVGKSKKLEKDIEMK